MTISSPRQPISWSCRIAIAVVLAFAAGSAMAKPLKRPDHFRPRAPAADPAAAKPDNAADKTPADALKAR
jgi:hypothetical protein